jgi:hypothetical protein
MALDPSDRTAVTGANDGTVNLWNFTQGVLLSSFCLKEPVVVTGFSFERVSILDRRVSFRPFEKGNKKSCRDQC